MAGKLEQSLLAWELEASMNMAVPRIVAVLGGGCRAGVPHSAPLPSVCPVQDEQGCSCSFAGGSPGKGSGECGAGNLSRGCQFVIMAIA